MKITRFILVLSCFIFVFNACSTDVDMYVDLKDTTIVYGVLDVANDTNVIKILRAFSGSNDDSFDVHQVALIADSSNYPGKLDARFIEYKKASGGDYTPSGREIILDTMTLHNKPEGLFYAPDQKVYYTTEHFKVSIAKNGGKTPMKITGDVPEEFLKYTPAPDNDKIREALDSGLSLDFAHFEERGTHLNIR